MKKRILSTLLIFCMVLGLLPISALAADSDDMQTTLDIRYGAITIGSNTVSGHDSDGNEVTEVDPDGYIITGTSTGYNYITIQGQATGSTITLKDLTLASKGPSPLTVVSPDSVTLDIQGAVTLSSSGGVAISLTSQSLSMTGTGSLAVTASSPAISNGSSGSGSFSAELDGDITLTSENTTVSGISAELVSANGSVSVSTTSSTMSVFAFSGTAFSAQAAGDVNITSASGTVISATGDVSLTSDTGAVAVSNGASPSTAIKTSGGGVTLSAPQGGVTVTTGAQWGIEAADDVAVTAGGDFTSSGICNSNGGVTLSAPQGNIAVTKGAQFGILATGDIAVTADGDFSCSGVTSGSGSVSVAGQDVTLTGDGTVPSVGANKGDVTLCASGTLTIPEASGTTPLPINISGQTLTISGALVNNARFQANTVSVPEGKTLVIPEGKVVLTTNSNFTVAGTLMAPAGSIGTYAGGSMAVTDTNAYTPATTGSGGIIMVASGEDVGTNGLDISTSAPTVVTTYTAGNGYILWEPASGDNPATVTLQDATINTGSTNFALGLPNGIDVTVVAKGTNSLTTVGNAIYHRSGNTTIEGDGTLNPTSTGHDYKGILCLNDDLTITGNVQVTASGYIQDIFCGGTLTISDHASVTASTGETNLFCINDIAVNTDGTINAPIIDLYGTFSYTKGSMTGSWVSENQGDTDANYLHSTYGNVTLSEDTTIEAMSGKDGLTVTTGSTLTIPTGITLTVEDDVAIINNGTIALPAGTTAAQITAMKLTGSSKVTVDGKSIVIIDGTLYSSGGDIGSTGLDLVEHIPTVVTAYKAGSGYILWEPASGDNPATVTLHDATTSTSGTAYALRLPNSTDVTVAAEGANSLTSVAYAIYHGSGTTTIQGDGTLNAISTGTSCAGIDASGLTITGGVTINASGNSDINTSSLTISGNASVTAPKSIRCNSHTTITVNTTGTVNAPYISALGSFSYQSGKMTGSWVWEGKEHYAKVISIYGSVQLSEDDTISYGAEGDGLTVTTGSTLTIPYGKTLTVGSGAAITNNGTLINNGTIALPNNTTAEGVKAAVALMKPTGTGKITVYNEKECHTNYYTNSGEAMNIVGGLDFSSQTSEISGDGYTWKGNSTDGYTLTLDNILAYDYGITLPTGCPVTIAVTGNTVIETPMQFLGSGACNLTIEGSGTLTFSNGIGGSTKDGDTVTVQGGVDVILYDRFSIGASGGANGTLNVTGSGTSLSVTTAMSSAVYCDTVTVSCGASLTVGAQTCGVQAQDVSVTGGSTLTAGCIYGVYIIGGKLTVDSTSKLITNASIAPFCVVDKNTTTPKAQSDVLSLSGTPSGTIIKSVTGTKGTYWSLTTGGSLSVTDEDHDIVTLSDAAKGTLTFVKTASPTDGGTGGSGGSNTAYTITATAGEGGSISPSGSVSITSGSSKTFAITANNGYLVKNVLVDGVSVGSVTSYTFEKVTKVHTISASFEKKTDGSFSDVKESDWFKDAVDYVTKKGLMNGISSTVFGPNESMTRAMLWTVLYRQTGSPAISDVETVWYGAARKWVMENGISDGTDPNGKVTREQVAAILYRYAQFKGYDTTKGGMAVREFSDYDEISDWALEAMAWAVNAGLISGKGNGVLDPNGSATRAQVATNLMRYCENVVK